MLESVIYNLRLSTQYIIRSTLHSLSSTLLLSLHRPLSVASLFTPLLSLTPFALEAEKKSTANHTMAHLPPSRRSSRRDSEARSGSRRGSIDPSRLLPMTKLVSFSHIVPLRLAPPTVAGPPLSPHISHWLLDYQLQPHLAVTTQNLIYPSSIYTGSFRSRVLMTSMSYSLAPAISCLVGFHPISHRDRFLTPIS